MNLKFIVDKLMIQHGDEKISSRFMYFLDKFSSSPISY